MSLPKKRRQLTKVETDIIRLVSRGYTNEEIADLLGIGTSTMSRRMDTIHALIGTSAAQHGGRGAIGIARVRMVIWAYENGVATEKVVEHDDEPRSDGQRAVRNASIEHGSYPGWQRHKRNGEKACETCEAAKRGYDVGVRHGGKEAATVAAASRLAERAFAVCRALVLKRPYPLVREQAVAVIRQRDAELEGDDPTWRAVA